MVSFCVVFITLIFTVKFLYLLILYYLFSSNEGTQKQNIPLIVFYTKYHEFDFLNETIKKVFEKCEFKCTVSDNYELYPSADMAIFHARNMKMSKFLEINSNPNRFNVFHSMEAFPHERLRRKHFPKDFFNITMSYRRDSTVWKPYDKFEEILSHEDSFDSFWTNEQINEKLSKKTNLAVQFVSHCETHSLREILIKKLERYISVKTYGSCGNQTDADEYEILDEYYFYFAFENAVCKDYITEKFWRLKQLIVPVVLKRSILKGIIEDEYFIAVDDFDTPKALSNYLIYLSKNIEEYKKYFKWTSNYKKTSAYDDREYCNLCKIAVEKEKHQISDIYQWWENDAQCQFNFMNFTSADVRSL